MQREDIKSYKDACKCIGRKPRQYKDTDMNTYEQLTTVIAALNFIANDNKPWQHKLHKGIPYSYVWYYGGRWSNDTLLGKFYLSADTVISSGNTNINTQLRLKERDDAEYLRTNFADLLFDWFRK